MNRFARTGARRTGLAVLSAAALGGFTAAALVGLAPAKSFSLQVARGAAVTNQSKRTVHENIAVTSSGAAVYTLSGDSKSHPECTKASGCFMVWPPVTVASARSLSKPPGLSGTLGVWQRNGFEQLTLGGHPLYRFAPDRQKDAAGGEGIHSFGGTWHVVKAAGSASGGGTPATSTSTTTSMTPCLYPPCH